MAFAANPALPMANIFGKSLSMIPERGWTGLTALENQRNSPPMHYAANIITLALWLSVAGFSAIAAYFPISRILVEPSTPEKQGPLEVSLDGISTVEADGRPSNTLTHRAPPLRPMPSLRPMLVRPRAMPTGPALGALPAIPNFPPARRAATASAGNGEIAGNLTPTSNRRFLNGDRPAAPYPPYSERNRQEGTVIVEFSVDSLGRVTAAFAKTPCRWPLLNQAAVRTVLAWRFPPGEFSVFQAHIVFRIQ